jgi:hypothetical protein
MLDISPLFFQILVRDRRLARDVLRLSATQFATLSTPHRARDMAFVGK